MWIEESDSNQYTTTVGSQKLEKPTSVGRAIAQPGYPNPLMRVLATAHPVLRLGCHRGLFDLMTDLHAKG